jgi:hypothetical protein
MAGNVAEKASVRGMQAASAPGIGFAADHAGVAGSPPFLLWRSPLKKTRLLFFRLAVRKQAGRRIPRPLANNAR